MAVAGKVAITLSTENGGAWSADVTYDRLVAVKHNNNLYISRKTVANVEPPNDEFWFFALEGFSGEDVEDIIDGTTQVGNAKTLDGHGAEYFAKGADLANYLPLTGGTLTAQHFLPLGLKNANGNNSYIQFEGNDSVLGYLGFESTNVLRLLSGVGGYLGDILHTGNKPTGTYTGNGSARTIDTGAGTLGQVCFINDLDSGSSMAIVSSYGSFGQRYYEWAKEGADDSVFENGVIRLSASSFLNVSGHTYKYYVI